MTQGTITLTGQEKASTDLVGQLVNALRMGTWRHRDELARCLGVSVRQIRDAASQSHGQVLSGHLGLKLTLCATPDELDEALGRMASQISETSKRIAATRYVWERRTDAA